MLELTALALTLLVGYLQRRDRLRFTAEVVTLKTEHRECQQTLADLRRRFDLVLTALGLDSEEPV